MSVVYDEKKIIPAPLVSVTKTYHKTRGGGNIGASYKLTLTGTLLPFRGSPNSTFTLDNPDNAFWQIGGYPADEAYAANNTDFANIQRKQEAIRWLFSREGKNFEWQAAGGQEVVKCNPRVISITFPSDQWADRCQYTIELEADIIDVARGSDDSEDNFDYDLINEGIENWQFDEQEGHRGITYNVSHNITAKSVQGYELNGQLLNDAWYNAELWCESKIVGSIPSGIMNTIVGATNWIAGSYVKNIGIGQEDGSYSISETWIMGSTNSFIEKEFSLKKTYQQNESVEISYHGTIYGLSDGERIGGQDAIVRAKAVLPTTAQAKTEIENALSGTNFLNSNTVPAIPKQKDIAIDNKNGIITFSFNWLTDEDDDYYIVNEALLSYNVSDGLYTMSYTATTEGKGETEADRLTNALAGIPATDAIAHNLASTLLSGQISDLPAGTTISSDPISRATAIQEKVSVVRASWVWNSSTEDNINIEVENTYPQYLVATINIPGRTAGPIIQRMNTKTTEKITVSYTSSGTSTKPNTDTIASIMDAAGGIPHYIDDDLFNLESYVLESDKERWNATTKKYSRTRTHVVTGD